MFLMSGIECYSKHPLLFLQYSFCSYSSVDTLYFFLHILHIANLLFFFFAVVQLFFLKLSIGLFFWFSRANFFLNCLFSP